MRPHQTKSRDRHRPGETALDDPKVYELLAKGDTIGIFQLESSGMRETLRQVAPDCIQDVIAILALYRPGPMQFIPDFTRRKHGKEEVAYDHPLLEPILKKPMVLSSIRSRFNKRHKPSPDFHSVKGSAPPSDGQEKTEVMAAQREKFVKVANKPMPLKKTSRHDL